MIISLKEKSYHALESEGGRAGEGALMRANEMHDAALYETIRNTLDRHGLKALENLTWLYDNMHFYFSITMKKKIDAIVALASALQGVINDQKIILTD
jgi:hypothetical protein